MKCQNCGTEIERKFCSNCGAPAPVENNQPPPPQTPPQQPQQSYQPYQNADMVIGRPPRQGLAPWQIVLIVLGAVIVGIVSITIIAGIIGAATNVSNTVSGDVSVPVIIDSSEESSEDTDNGEYLTDLPGIKYKVENFKTKEVIDGRTFNKLSKHVSLCTFFDDDPVLVSEFNGLFAGESLKKLITSMQTSDDALSDVSLTQQKIGDQIAYCYTETATGDNVSLRAKYIIFANKQALIVFQFIEPAGDSYEKNDKEFDKVINSIIVDPQYVVSAPSVEFDINAIETEVLKSSVSSTPPASSAPVASSAPQAPTSSTAPASSAPAPTTPKQDTPVSSAPPPPAPAAGATIGQENALKSAKSYLSFTAFSYSGLIKQLEFEKFSTADATYAANNCGANWTEQALKSAKSYLDFAAFSYQGLIEQLEFEGFTNAEATYGASNCGADWNVQAAKSAKSYLEFSSFSRESLIDQLVFEGFTYEQAAYGASAAGY